ncbi:amine oxidase [Apiospora rasikravindrae]|uniref:Amine oxidase n=1 Tax=Apiospora rasikravindrae TaxID=990691 RepID=A0ABR1S165_9PEZI
MSYLWVNLLSILAALTSIPASAGTSSNNAIKTDVVIVGGGAGGAHAALRLMDMGKRIILIEQDSILGGNVDSYTTPGTDNSMDFGVFSFIDYGGATALFERLNSSTAPPARVRAPTKYADFTTGELIPDYAAPVSAAAKAAMEKYLSICEQYEDMIIPGYWNFPTGDGIPKDLLLRFGNFVKRHGIEDAVPQIYAATGFGVGRQADELTLTVMQAFGAQMARSMLGRQGGFITASHRNQDVYDAMAREIGEEFILYETKVVRSVRTPDDGVVLTARNQMTGKETTIHATKLLMAIRPVGEEAMRPFDLNERERSIFSKFDYHQLWAALVRHPSLTAGNTTVNNFPVAVAPSNYLETPQVPFIGKFELQDNTAGGLESQVFRSLVIGTREFGYADAKELLQSSLDRLVEQGILPRTYTGDEQEQIEVVVISDHGPSHVRVSADELRDGFFQKLYALQGHRSTWWTGAAFASHFQTIIWEFNEVLLPQMLGGK